MTETTPIYHRWLAAGLLALAILAVTPLLDQRASVHYDDLFERALVTFALARTLNGVISAVQGTELALQPAGVGVTLTPGEILDPVNDLVERFSWIMLGATVSLGIQQVLLELSAWWVIQGLVAVLALWLVVLLIRERGDASPQRSVVTRVLLVALFLRFAVPLTMIANDALYQWFLEPRYTDSTEVITSAGAALERLGEDPAEPVDPAPADESTDGPFYADWFDSVGEAFSGTAAKMDLAARVDAIQARAADMIEHLIQLSVVFILQTGLMPIVFLWLFLQGAKRLFRPLNLK